MIAFNGQVHSNQSINCFDYSAVVYPVSGFGSTRLALTTAVQASMAALKDVFLDTQSFHLQSSSISSLNCVTVIPFVKSSIV